MILSRIAIFPVKGFAALYPETADVEPWGLAGDRRWLVVDPAGRFITQREVAGMALLRAVPQAGGLVLAAPGVANLLVPWPGPDAAVLQVTVWKDTVPARDAGAEAATWVSAALGQPCRLVHLHDPWARQIPAKYAPQGGHVTFADALPVLLASATSMADLNGRLAAPMQISRFRANLEVAGALPWAEDGWRRLGIGAQAIFRVANPCERCLVTTIEQETGARPDKSEPLRTLAGFRRTAQGVIFGQNLLPEVLGRVAVGDEVTVLEGD